MGMLHLRNQDFDAALVIARQLGSEQPKNPFPHNLAGVTQALRGDLAAARTSLERAVVLDPGYLPALYNLAWLDLQAGKIDDARRRYLAATKTNPRETRALVELARIATFSGRLETATAWLEKARAIETESMQIDQMLANLYLRSGRPKQALEIARSLKIRHSRNPQVLETLGRAEFALGDVEAAIDTFRVLSHSATGSVPELLRVAQIQQSIGDYRGALWSLSAVISLDSHYRPARDAIIEFEAIAAGTEKSARKSGQVARGAADVGDR